MGVAWRGSAPGIRKDDTLAAVSVAMLNVKIRTSAMVQQPQGSIRDLKVTCLYAWPLTTASSASKVPRVDGATVSSRPDA